MRAFAAALCVRWHVYARVETAVNQYGQGIASFLLGLPLNGSFIEIRPEQDYSVMSHGFFVHDDWRVGDKLTLNLGVRYDLELGMTEAENRNVARLRLHHAQSDSGAGPGAVRRQSSSRRAADRGAVYRARRLPVCGRCESTHLGCRHNNFQPRFGFTYAATPTTVVRGGAGLFISPFQINPVPGLGNPVNQLGFARQTPIPVSSDNGLTFQANLTNPVPSGQLLQPNGSSLGLRTNLGASIGTATAAGIIPTDWTNPEYWRFSVGVERQLGNDWLVELSYLGQKGSHVPLVEQLNFVPQAYRTTSAIRDNTAETFLSQVVSNPFQGLTPESRAATVRPLPGGGCCCSIRTSTT